MIDGDKMRTVGMLQMGDKGVAVRSWQRELINFGLDITMDGDFGPDTKAATRSFQRQNSLRADGIVGKNTRRAMAIAIDGRIKTHTPHARHVPDPVTGTEPADNRLVQLALAIGIGAAQYVGWA